MGMGYNTVNLLMIMTIYSVNGYPLTNSKNFNATLVVVNRGFCSCLVGMSFVKGHAS